MEFSKQLAEATTPVEERRDLQAQAQELSINALQNISDSKLDFSKNNPNRVKYKRKTILSITDTHFYFQLDWAQYLREVFHGVNVTFDTDTDLIIVMDSKYFQKLSFLLQKTSPETIGIILSSPKIFTFSKY